MWDALEQNLLCPFHYFGIYDDTDLETLQWTRGRYDLAELSKVDPQAESSGVITQTIELYDFDQPVDIAIPPASEVTDLDLSKLLGSVEGHGN